MTDKQGFLGAVGLQKRKEHSSYDTQKDADIKTETNTSKSNSDSDSVGIRDEYLLTQYK